jgi:tRNA1(Val) A37 N6-methylase TrmN6
MLLLHEITIQNMTFIRQTINHNYFRIMMAGKIVQDNDATEMIIDEIAIKDDKGAYTIQFKELLKDYYLFL